MLAHSLLYFLNASEAAAAQCASQAVPARKELLQLDRFRQSSSSQPINSRLGTSSRLSFFEKSADPVHQLPPYSQLGSASILHRIGFSWCPGKERVNGQANQGCMQRYPAATLQHMTGRDRGGDTSISWRRLASNSRAMETEGSHSQPDVDPRLECSGLSR